MKFKCKICGQQIDNPYICPFCGSGSDHIILIDEEDEEIIENNIEENSNEELNISNDNKKLNESNKLDDGVHESLNKDVESENNDQIDLEANINQDDNILNKPNELQNIEDDSLKKDLVQKDMTNKNENLEENTAEIDYFFKIYGYLYLHNIELAKQFKIYLDYYILEKSLLAAKEFTDDDFKCFTSNNDFLNTVVKQFKL